MELQVLEAVGGLGEGQAPGQELVGDHPQGVEVGAPVEGLGLELRPVSEQDVSAVLGGGVLGRAGLGDLEGVGGGSPLEVGHRVRAGGDGRVLHRPSGGHRGRGLVTGALHRPQVLATEVLADAEVDHLGGLGTAAALGQQQDVLGLEVQVQDRLALAHEVGCPQGPEDLQHEAARPAPLEGALAVEHRVQVLPLEQLHDEVVAPVGGAVEALPVDDVGVVEARDAHRLAAEGLEGRVGLGGAGQHHLEGHPVARTAFVDGLVDRAEAAGADLAQDAVLVVEQGPEQGVVRVAALAQGGADPGQAAIGLPV